MPTERAIPRICGKLILMSGKFSSNEKDTDKNVQRVTVGEVKLQILFCFLLESTPD